MISHENPTKSILITVCNHDSYQDNLHDRRTIDLHKQ